MATFEHRLSGRFGPKDHADRAEPALAHHEATIRMAAKENLVFNYHRQDTKPARGRDLQGKI